MSAPALAADVNPKRHTPMDLPAPPPDGRVDVPQFGLYFGAEGGYQVTTIKPDVPYAPDNVGESIDGFVGGLTGGFDTGYGPVKLGLCASAGLSNLKAEGYEGD